jgi:threonine dehydratase
MVNVATVVNAEMVRDAAERIRNIAHRTPVLRSRSFDEQAGVSAFFKCENFQKGGAFKIRGASNFIFSMPVPSLERGVVAYSSGNHAQAVAMAARYLSIPATLVMPSDAPKMKMEATRAQGAEIITYDRDTDSREAIGLRLAAERGATLVPPFDHPLIIAGQGTATLELLEDLPYLEAIIAPVGGGGLLSGAATIAKSINPEIRVFGAEPENANDTYLSLKAGERRFIPSPDTIADGLRAPVPGEITFPILREHVERIILVTEEEIKAAVKFLLMRLKILVEPSGAVPAAAILSGKLPRGVHSIGVILSGGNVDFDDLKMY